MSTASDQLRSPRESTNIPYVPAGTTFRVRLDQTLGTTRSVEGQEWSATVLDNVRGAEGRFIIPAGAGVRGTVVEVDRGPSPRITVDIDSVQTRYGVAQLDARIVRTEAPGVLVLQLTRPVVHDGT